jgi:hypothetical protein
MVPPRCTGSALSAATRSRTRAGLNVRSQSAEAGLRDAGGSLQAALEELRRFLRMREDQGHGDGGA